MLFQTMIAVGTGDPSDASSPCGVNSAEHMITKQLLTHFNIVRPLMSQGAGRVAEPAAGTGGGHPARHPGDTVHRPAAPLHRERRTAGHGRRLLAVAGDAGLCRLLR